MKVMNDLIVLVASGDDSVSPRFSTDLISILSSSELTEVWVAVEDKLEVLTIPNKDTVSSTHLLDSLPAKHIIGE